ncbi:hypothetical protein [Telluria aromaticivorans]|nr:hypothetical protein [Telluria aromaticivorans]
MRTRAARAVIAGGEAIAPDDLAANDHRVGGIGNTEKAAAAD